MLGSHGQVMGYSAVLGSGNVEKMAVCIENTRVSSDVPPILEVLVGTYEEFVLGYKLSQNSEGVCFNNLHINSFNNYPLKISSFNNNNYGTFKFNR